MNNPYRIDVNKLIETYADVEVGDLDKMYSSMYEVVTTTSFLFDDSGDVNVLADSAASLRVMDFSNNIETMDEVEYSRYG